MPNDELLELDEVRSREPQPRQRFLDRLADRRLLGAGRHPDPAEELVEILRGGVDLIESGAQPLRELLLHLPMLRVGAPHA